MNSGHALPELTRPILSEAGAWMARLNGPYRSRRVEQGFQKWLKDDPRHAEAFRLIAVDWEGIGELKRFASVSIGAPAHTAVMPAQRRAISGLPLAAAAVLVAAVAAAFYFVGSGGVTTGVGEQRILTLADGTRVHLNTATHIVERYGDSERLIHLESGEALFEVAKESGRPFVVEAGGQRVRALGTSFVVRKDRDRLAVTLVDGKVAVSSVELSPGQRLTVTGHRPPVIDRPEISRLTAWQQGKVAIDHMRLSEVVAEMNRYSTLELVIEAPQTQRLFISGVFSVGQSASFARAVAQSYGLEVVERGDRIVLAGLPRSVEVFP
jgi:transmembrane sensor